MRMPRWAERLRRPPAKLGRARSELETAIELSLLRLEDRRVLDAAGVLFADLNPGAGSSSPAGAVEFNGQLIFSAEGKNACGESVGRELYRLDEKGQTSLVADINAGEGSSNPEGFTEFHGDLYFSATGNHGRELYRLDAKGAVTRVSDINPGKASSDPTGLTAFNGNLYFAATGAQGRELYRVGDCQRVQLVQDINQGSASSNPHGFTEFDGKLYFAATGAGEREPYVLNREGHAHKIADLNPGRSSSNPAEFTVFHGALYFTATSEHGRTLYRQSANGNHPVRVLDCDIVSNPTNLTAFGDHLYFSADNRQGGSQLFAIDARDCLTEIETSAGQPLQSPSSFTVFNGALYFTATAQPSAVSLRALSISPPSRGLYRLDLNGCAPVAVPIELPAGVALDTGQPEEFREFQGNLYFAANGPSGREFYRVNPLDEVELATDLNPGEGNSNPTNFVVFAGNFYFSARTPETGRELFRLATVSSTTITIADGELRLTDAAGEHDNRIVISSDGEYLTIRDENGHDIVGVLPGMTGSGTNQVVISLASLAGVHRLAVDLRGGDDSFTWNAAQSADSLLAQFTTITVAGGSNSRVGGDYLRVVGDGSLSAIYLPDETGPGEGRIEIDGGGASTTIRFTTTEGLDVTGMDRAVFVAPLSETGADNILATAGKDARDGTIDALVVSGSSSGVLFEDVHFFANRIVEISTERNSDGGDIVTLLNVGGAHANGSLFVTTAATKGDESDRVSIQGDLTLSGELGVFSDHIQIAGKVQAGGDVQLIAQESVEFLSTAALAVTGNADILVEADADDCGNDPILMRDGATIFAGSGSVTLLAGGTIQVSDVRTKGDATLVSRHGALLDVDDDESVDVTAATALFEAARGVGATGDRLETRLGQLKALSGGGIWIANDGALRLQSAQSNGPVSIENDGQLTVVGSVQSAGGAISLESTGDLVLNAKGLIDTQAGSAGVVLESAGAISMANGSVVEARDGRILVTSRGNIVLSDLRTKGDAAITSTHGAILDLEDCGGLDLVAASANLHAALGIGAAENPLEMRLGQLTAASGGGLWLINDGALRFQAVDTSGDLSIENHGAITFAGAVRSGGGSIVLDACGDLVFDANAVIDTQSGAANVVLKSDGAITMADGSIVQARDGRVEMTSFGNFIVSDIQTTAQAWLSSTHGAILDLDDSGALDLVAASANLHAALGIGAAENPLETRLGQLQAVSGGGVWINNASDLRIGPVTAGGDIALNVAGNATVFGNIVTRDAGQLLLDATGSVRIDASLNTNHGDIRLLSGKSVTVSDISIHSDSGDILFIADHDGNGSGTLQIAAQIFVGAGDAIFSLPAADGQFSGSVQGGGSFVKRGTGSLELTSSSHNSYSGRTDVLAGTLIVNGVIGANGAAGTVVIAGGATLAGGGVVFAPVFASSVTAQILVTGNLRLGDGAAQGIEFAGRLLIGAGQVLVLRDANFAELGVLTQLGNGATIIAAAGIQVPGGGRLTGNGAIDGALRVLSSGATTPGDNIGVLGVGNLELLSGAEFRVDVQGVTAGTSHDQLRVTGSVSVQGARLLVSSLTFDAARGTVLVLISNDGVDPISGRFVDANGAALNEGAVIRVGQHNAVLSYAGGSGGNDVTLTLGQQVFFAFPGLVPGVASGGQHARDTNTSAAVFAYFAAQIVAAGGNLGTATTPLLITQDARNGGKAETTYLRGASRDELSTRIEQRFRLYFRVYFDALAREGEQEYDLAPEALRNLTAVFRRHRFPNGHFKVYLQEFGSKAERLILDVQVYDGRVVTEPLQEDENESQLQSQPAAEPAAKIPDAGSRSESESSGGQPAHQSPSDVNAQSSIQPATTYQSAASPAALLLMSALRRRCRAETQDPKPARRQAFSRYSYLLRRPR